MQGLLGGSTQTVCTGGQQTLASPLVFVSLLIPVLSSLPMQQQHWGFWMVPPSQGGWQGHFQLREQGCCGVAVPQAGALATGSKHCLATALALELNRAEGV